MNNNSHVEQYKIPVSSVPEFKPTPATNDHHITSTSLSYDKSFMNGKDYKPIHDYKSSDYPAKLADYSGKTTASFTDHLMKPNSVLPDYSLPPTTVDYAKTAPPPAVLPDYAKMTAVGSGTGIGDFKPYSTAAAWGASATPHHQYHAAAFHANPAASLYSPQMY